MNKSSSPKTQAALHAGKRMAVYARVSTQEQTKGQYPSHESQIEELVAFCKAKGWQVVEEIKDEGHRAGTLWRQSLTRLRHLIETEQIDGIVCTWYNRLIGSRDFYILDKEFKAHNVSFVTIHDPADRNTTAGRLLESMLVTVKTFENEQVGEKVRAKMRMRAEKACGMAVMSEAQFRSTLQDFPRIREHATPQELQNLLRVIVRQVEWMPDKTHTVQYYLDDKV